MNIVKPAKILIRSEKHNDRKAVLKLGDRRLADGWVVVERAVNTAYVCTQAVQFTYYNMDDLPKS